ncbi:MAG: hypothetical protein IT437_07345 [Phycisphaerales bacterium]|nr:hypothetical protein [Phycisphaerales bacterium]
MLSRARPRYFAYARGTTDRPGSARLRVLRLDDGRAEIAHVELPGDWVRVRKIERDPEDPDIAVIVLGDASGSVGIRQGWVGVQIEGEGAPGKPCLADFADGSSPWSR